VNEKGIQYLDPSVDSPISVPGFAEQLEGMEKGVAKEFQISFPADYAIEEYAGKTYSFKVVVTEIKERVLPELDDEFAKGVGEGFESLDLLRQRVTADLKARVEEEEKRRYEDRVVEAVMGLAQVDIPDILVEREIDFLVDEETQPFRLRGGRLEDYLRNIKRTEEELRAELRSLANLRVLRSLVLSKVAEEESIAVDSEEVGGEIEKMVEAAGEGAEAWRRLFDSPSARQSVERALFARKTVQRLVEIASAEDIANEDANEEEAENVVKVSDSMS
jgi:trigger factor